MRTINNRQLKLAAIAFSMLLLLVVIPAYGATNNPPKYPRDLLRLKSGGVASQVASDEPSSGPSSSSAEGPPFQWEKNINVFPNPNEQDEPTIAVNPNSPDNIVVGNHERQGPAFPAAILCAFEASVDGGATWTRFGVTALQGPAFPAAGGHSCSDPVLAADRSGNFYYAYLDLFRFTSPLRVDLLVQKSTTGGQTFSSFVVVARGTGSGPGAEDPDKEWIEVDRNPQSSFQGNTYVSYSDFSTLTIKFRKSVDGGATFQPGPSSFGTVVSDVGGQVVTPRPDICHNFCFDFQTRYMQGSYIAVGPKGEIYVFYGDFTEIETFDFRKPFPDSFLNARMIAAKIMVAKSTDGGSTWTRSVVNDMCSPAPCRSAGTDSTIFSTPPFRMGTLPFGDVGPNGNFVYAVWAEYQSVTFLFDAPTNRDFRVANGDIMFARTADGGLTWEPAIRVNDDATTNDQFMPAMVAQPDGAIHIVWADRRLDANNIIYDIFYATSTDNGKSFKSNVRVTTASSDPRPVRFIGDYIDIDGASGTFKIHAVWTDRRITNTRNDVFTAKRLMPPPS